MKNKYYCDICGKEFDKSYDCKLHEDLCKKENEDVMVYVAECFCISQTVHENPRFYSIFKKTVLVSDKFVNSFRELKRNDYKKLNEIFESKIICELPSRFIDMILEEFCMYDEFNEKTIDKITDNYTFMNRYSNLNEYPNDDLVCEIHFKSNYIKPPELGYGFLSIYKLEKYKLEFQENVDIELRKWITNNICR